MSGTRTQSRETAQHALSALRDTLTNYNQLVADMEVQRLIESSDTLNAWTSVGNSAFNAAPMGRGSTDTNLATGQFMYSIAGTLASKAAVAAGTAFGALGTIPANVWGVITMEIASGGAFSFQSGAANYTTGYTSEAAALAASPAPVQGKARVGLVTILAPAAGTFVVGTNSLAGGATNPAQTTNYYPSFGVMSPTGNHNYFGGANGIMISNVGLVRGSTDTRVGWTQFSFNANGISHLNGAANAAGVAFANPPDGLSTVVQATPAGLWLLIVMYIDAAATVTFQAAPGNLLGYTSEIAAQRDLRFVPQPVGKCRMGYVTIQAASGNTFTPATDALAGGASGHPAQTTNYYNQTGPIGGIGVTQVYQQGMLASQVGFERSLITADLTENAIAILPTSGI